MYVLGIFFLILAYSKHRKTRPFRYPQKEIHVEGKIRSNVLLHPRRVRKLFRASVLHKAINKSCVLKYINIIKQQSYNSGCT